TVIECFRGLFFFFSSRRRHTRSKRDWSSDVCSSDLVFAGTQFFANFLAAQHAHAAAQRSGQIVIASAGQAQVSIVLGERSNETYQFAAAELAKYLKILSGATVKIVSDGEVATTQESMLIVGGTVVNKTAKETAS